MLSAVAGSRLRRLGIPLVPGQTVDWHGLSLRIVGSDAAGALAALPETLRAAITDTVHGSVAEGRPERSVQNIRASVRSPSWSTSARYAVASEVSSTRWKTSRSS